MAAHIALIAGLPPGLPTVYGAATVALVLVLSLASGDRLHDLSAFRLALLSCSRDVSGVACARLGPRFRQTTWPLCTSARFAVVLE